MSSVQTYNCDFNVSILDDESETIPINFMENVRMDTMICRVL
jgi:hypothetical protein